MYELRGRHVLVTRAAGFIGANLVQALLRYGAEVHAIVRPNSNLWRIEKLLPDLHLHAIDITDREGLKKTVLETSPEIIYHLAAQGVSPAFQEHYEILRTNILGTFNLLEATAPLDYQLFVHLGGSSEYGAKHGPMRESDCPEPLTFYGAAKAAATLLCRQQARANGRPVVALRAFSVMTWQGDRGIMRMRPSAIFRAMKKAGFGRLKMTRFGFFPPFLVNRPWGPGLKAHWNGWLSGVLSYRFSSSEGSCRERLQGSMPLAG